MNAPYEINSLQAEPLPSQSASLLSFPKGNTHNSPQSENRTTTIAVFSSSEISSLQTVPFQNDITALNKSICSNIYKIFSDLKSPFPQAVIKELVENFIHADYLFPSIIISDEGYTVIFSDHGPGIIEPHKALRQGFSAITPFKKKYIRGMGLGFPLIKSLLGQHHGTISIEDNIDSGCVITLKIPKPLINSHEITKKQTNNEEKNNDNSISCNHYLSHRQREVLMVVADNKGAGPSAVSKMLGTALSTAYRDLIYLEECNFIYSSSGKRLLTSEGISYLMRFKKGDKLDRN